MALVVIGLTVVMLTPVAAYGYYTTVYKPRAGRAAQEQAWRAVVERMQGCWDAGTRAFQVPFGSIVVTAAVTDRAGVDGALEPHYPRGELGARTVIQARVIPGRAPTSFLVEPGRGGLPVGDLAFQARHRVTALLGTPPGAIRPRFDAPVCRAFGLLGGGYRILAVGPSSVSLEIPGVCTDAAQLEAAVCVVGAIARA